MLRMDRVSLMDQSGAYAVHDALVELARKGVRCLIVGLPVAQRDILEDICVIPDVIPDGDVFDDFAHLKSALPAIISE